MTDSPYIGPWLASIVRARDGLASTDPRLTLRLRPHALALVEPAS